MEDNHTWIITYNQGFLTITIRLTEEWLKSRLNKSVKDITLLDITTLENLITEDTNASATVTRTTTSVAKKEVFLNCNKTLTVTILDDTFVEIEHKDGRHYKSSLDKVLKWRKKDSLHNIGEDEFNVLIKNKEESTGILL